MPRLWRLSTLILFITLLPLLITSCVNNTLRVSKRDVSRSLCADTINPDVDKRIVAAGEKAIPLIFDVLRESGSEQADYRAGTLIIGMIQKGTADPSAPYIRSVLENQQEDNNLRKIAADLLIWYEHPLVIDCLTRQTRSDAPRTVHLASLQSLGRHLKDSISKNNWQEDKETVVLLETLLNDKDVVIRTETCKLLGDLALDAKRNGASAAWANNLFAHSKNGCD